MASTINADTSNGVVITPDTSGEIQLQSAGTTAVTIDTSQNVGIGTTSPTNFGSNFKMLAVQGSDFGVMQAISSSGSTTLEMMGASGVGYVGTRTNHPLALRTNDTERMRINSNGIVTMPYQPAFMASGGVNATFTAGQILSFSSTSLNRGNHFSAATYKFTAPVTGVYSFSVSIYAQGNISIAFYVNGLQAGAPTPLMTSPSAGYEISGTLVRQLNANDTVSVHSRSTQSSPVFMPHSAFSGYLIG